MSAGDDFRVNIWDLKGPDIRENDNCMPFIEPMLTYNAKNEVTTIQWPISNPEWFSVTFGNKVQVLKI